MRVSPARIGMIRSEDSSIRLAIINDFGRGTITTVCAFGLPAAIGELKGDLGIVATKLLTRSCRLRRCQGGFMIRIGLGPYIAETITKASVMLCDVVSDCHL